MLTREEVIEIANLNCTDYDCVPRDVFAFNLEHIQDFAQACYRHGIEGAAKCCESQIDWMGEDSETAKGAKYCSEEIRKLMEE